MPIVFSTTAPTHGIRALPLSINAAHTEGTPSRQPTQTPTKGIPSPNDGRAKRVCAIGIQQCRNSELKECGTHNQQNCTHGRPPQCLPLGQGCEDEPRGDQKLCGNKKKLNSHGNMMGRTRPNHGAVCFPPKHDKIPAQLQFCTSDDKFPRGSPAPALATTTCVER
ncbi:hypothetical protein BX600DRAFT_155333 [Xylariales sp. PMI_506]|nr:hypothetical protein BX600DRAFT_155333 [Xylariales sp. PMI_506]